MIRVSVDLSYPKFVGLTAEEKKQVAVSIGPAHAELPTLPYDAYPLNISTVGDSVVNPRSFMVSVRRPLLFTREAFALFGNVTVDTYQASRLGAILADLVTRGAITVVDTAGPVTLTPAQILTFVP